MKLLIREVRPEDASDIVEILNPIIEARVYTVLDTPLTIEEEKEFINNFPTRGIFHVAESISDGKVVGFQTLEPFATYTHAFDHVAIMGTFVALPLRRQGIGTQLARATFEIAPAKGFEKIFTYVRACNLEALMFYLKLGFRVVGTAYRQVKLYGKYEDEFIIEKLL